MRSVQQGRKDEGAAVPMTKLRHWWGGPPTVRYAWLATTLFDTIEQVQDKAMRWLWTYNHERPNMALGGITPAMKLAMAA
jgi:transposase InsO family protein